LSGNGRLDASAFPKLVWLVFLLSALILLAIMATLVLKSHSQDVYGIEQNVVYSLQLLIADKPLYSHPEYPPYNVVQYTPAYYALVDVLAGFLRLEAADVLGIYALARFSSAFFGLATALLLVRLCYEFGLRGNDILAALLFALLLPMPWFLVARPDSMMVFFEFLAFYTFIHYLQNGSKKTLYIAGVSLALALYSKQTALIFLGLYLIFPFYQQQIWDRLRLLSAFALGLLGIALLLWNYANLWPGSENYFYLNVIGGVTNSTDLQRALWVYSIYGRVFLGAIVLPILITILAGLQFWRNGRTLGFCQAIASFDKIFLFLLMSVWATALIAMLMSLKSASAINYMNESMLIVILLCSYFLAKRGLNLSWQSNRYFRPGIALLLFFNVMSIAFYWFTLNGADTQEKDAEAIYSETLSVMHEEFSVHPESHFIYFPQNAYDRWLNLYFYENSFLTPREVYMVAYFDLSSLQTYLDNGSLRYLITDKSAFPENIFGYTNLQDYFELWQETDTHLIYRNRNSE
jgi:hypothetical protein